MQLIWKMSLTCFPIQSSSINLCNNVLISSSISWWILRDIFIPQTSVMTLWKLTERGSPLIFNISWKMFLRRTPIVLVVSLKIICRGLAKRICDAQLAQQLDCVLGNSRCGGLIVSLKVFNFSSSRNTKLCNANLPEVFQSWRRISRFLLWWNAKKFSILW